MLHHFLWSRVGPIDLNTSGCPFGDYLFLPRTFVDHGSEVDAYRDLVYK